MNYDFETFANKKHIGNMKGSWQEDLPEGALLLSGAEFDYPTAPCIRECLIRFSQNGLYGYTLPDSSYRRKISYWMQLARGWTIRTDDIVPTLGTIFGLSTAIRAFTAPGDGVIIQQPAYSRFGRAVLRNGRKVTANPMIEEHGTYRLDPDDLERKMADPSNRLLVLCNPHNPTGKVFSEQELQEIAALAARYKTIVFSDEIFAETAQPGHPAIPYAALDPEHGITSTSLGKAFSLTGTSHANLIIPNARLRETYRRQRDIDHFGSIDPFLYQALDAAYSPDGFAWLQEMNRHNAANYRILCQAVEQEMPRLSLSPLEGTYVAWLDLRNLGLGEKQRIGFLEKEALIFGDAGEEYGPAGTGFVRLNLAAPASCIRQAAKQLAAACQKRGF